MYMYIYIYMVIMTISNDYLIKELLPCAATWASCTLCWLQGRRTARPHPGCLFDLITVCEFV